MKILIKLNHLILYFLLLLLIIVVGARGATRDTEIYYNIYRNINSYDLCSFSNFYHTAQVEIGYGWYSYLISLISQNSSFLLFFPLSLITFVAVLSISRKLQAQEFLVLLLYVSSAYFLILQFMQMRQGLAVPLALLSITMLFSKKYNYVKFLVFAVLAFSFHQVSFVVALSGLLCFFLVSFLLNKNISLNNFRAWSIFIFLISVVISKYVLLDIMINFSERLSAYANNSYGEEIGFFRLPNIKAFLVFIFILIFMNKKIYENRLFLVFFIMYIIGVSMRFGFSEFAILGGRFASALTFTEIFILPFIFSRFVNGGLIIFLIYVAIQFFLTYFIQAPYVIEDYFKPIYDYVVY
ncbi:EpsG family protein [Lonepinella sp. BR2271]|uniref:EpsG family protein n=1 Tax=Lonepinella sp. BR2271 TaxID=3434550 RepID=UPI003F6DE33E